LYFLLLLFLEKNPVWFSFTSKPRFFPFNRTEPNRPIPKSNRQKRKDKKGKEKKRLTASKRGGWFVWLVVVFISYWGARAEGLVENTCGNREGNQSGEKFCPRGGESGAIIRH